MIELFIIAMTLAAVGEAMPARAPLASKDTIVAMEAEMDAARDRYSRASGNTLLEASVAADNDARLCALAPAIAATTEWIGTITGVDKDLFIHDGIVLKLRIGRRFVVDYRPLSSSHEIADAVATLPVGATISFSGEVSASTDFCSVFRNYRAPFLAAPRLYFEKISDIRAARP